MLQRTLYFILLLFLITDLGYSFLQHSSQPLYGDIAEGVVPASHFENIFDSPLGLDALLNNKTYPNPNRFFSHWMFKEYFTTVPFWLQKLVSPIDSIYLSSAIAKTAIQLFLILLLAVSITGIRSIFKIEFLVAMILVTPFFQTYGYYNYMAIIDSSITYAFFYALPVSILLFYLFPVIQKYHHSEKFADCLAVRLIWVPLSIVVCLSGPLNPGIILVFSFLVLLANVKNTCCLSNKTKLAGKIKDLLTNLPRSYLIYLVPVGILSVYSLIIGRYNSHETIYQVPLIDLYMKLPAGIYYQFTQKPGFPVLFLILAVNTVLIGRYYQTTDGKKLLTIFKWIGVFSILYILLLPLGGYRDYRPYVLRYDTIIPITLSLMFIFGATTTYLFRQKNFRQKLWYIPLIVTVLLIFTYADKPDFSRNKYEKLAMKELAESNEKVVVLPENYILLSWGKITKPEDSELNSQLLLLWNVTDEKKLYYNTSGDN
jgi:hypothetical protein